MCGGHGLFQLLTAASIPSVSVPEQDFRQQVKLLYARGEIDTAAFHRFMEMAEGGYLQAEDLPGLLVHSSSGTQPNASHASLSKSERQASDLEMQISRLMAAAEDAEADSQHPGLSEDEVRAYLETRQGALFRAEALQHQLDELRANLV